MSKKKQIVWPALGEGAIILAVDPSLRCSGWVLMRADESLIKTGTIPIKDKFTGIAALHELAKEVRFVLSRLDHRVSLLVIEEQYTPSKGRGSALQRTAQASGVWIGNFPYSLVIEAYPATWGAAMGLPSKRDAKKAAMQQIAKNLYPFIEWEEDNADALGIGLYACRNISLARKAGQ